MNPIKIEYENLNKLNAQFTNEFNNAFQDFLTNGQFVLGKNVAAFEQEYAAWTGATHCVGLANGLDALTISLICAQFPPKSEVIVPSNTYIATINSIILAGHIPVFVEPDIKTYNIDPQKIEEKINAKTKALMVVHLYGKSCQMDKIQEICQKHKLFLIEDCAQSHGATFKGQQTGTFGDAGAFSFYPTKNLGALGDAGAVTVKNPELYERIKAYRNYGQVIKYKNDFIGVNSRLDEIQAIFLRIKLKKLHELNAHKQKLAQIYLNELPASFILPEVHKDYSDVFHIFAIRHPERDRLQKYLTEKGIGTIIHYPIAPIDQVSIQDYFEQNSLTLHASDFVIAREIHQTILSLPCSGIHTEKDVMEVVKALKAF